MFHCVLNVNDPYHNGTSTAGLETYIMGTHNWIIRYNYLSLHYREAINIGGNITLPRLPKTLLGP